MEEEAAPDARGSPNLRLQTTTLPGYPVTSLSPSFKLDEGYSDDTRSQADKDLAPDHVMMLPDWVLAQSEANRAGKTHLTFLAVIGSPVFLRDVGVLTALPPQL